MILKTQPHGEQVKEGLLERFQSPLIELHDLYKNYGTKTAVDHINRSVFSGEVFGFLGPNGAGRTTTIKMIVGLLRPTSGTVKVAGYDTQEQPLQAKISSGFVPDKCNQHGLTGAGNVPGGGSTPANPDAGNSQRGLVPAFYDCCHLAVPKRGILIKGYTFGIKAVDGTFRFL